MDATNCRNMQQPDPTFTLVLEILCSLSIATYQVLLPVEQNYEQMQLFSI